MKKKRVATFLFFLQSLFLIFLLPSLEYPDATAHIVKIFSVKSNEIYINIIHYFVPFFSKLADPTINFTFNENFKYFFWEPLLKHDNYNSLFIMLTQLINLVIIYLFINIYNLMIVRDNGITIEQKNKFSRMNVIYYLYPAVSYLILGITPDFVIYIFQPFFIYFLFRKKLVTAFLCSLLVYIYGDDSGIINILFISIYILLSFFNKIKVKPKKLIITILSFIFIFGIAYYFRNNIYLFKGKSEILNIMEIALTNNGNLTTKIVNFYMSSFSLWGSASFTTFIPLYILYGWYLLKIIYKSYHDSSNSGKEYFDLLLTSILTICFIILLYPSYSHIRFFMFFPLIIILGYFKYIVNDENILNNKKFFNLIYFFFFHNVILALCIFIKIFLIKNNV